MANINIVGINLSDGQFKPITPADTPTDTEGNSYYGATGAIGATGLLGSTGFAGQQGATGLTGATGITGRTGIIFTHRGVTGTQGVTGLSGATGVLNGATGSTGTTGVQGFTGVLPGSGAYSFLTAATTITSSAKILGIDTSGGPITVTLPLASSLTVGQEFIFQDESGMASINNITIATSGGDLIAGTSTHVMNTNYEGADIMCDNVAFYVLVSKFGATGLLVSGPTGVQGTQGVPGTTGIQGATGVA